MNILFLSDNFPPEVNAPAARTYEHCKEWAKQGHKVKIITCFPNFPAGKVFGGYRNKLFQKESMEGITVFRVWSFITANKGLLKRIIDYFSFSVSAFLLGLFIKTDIIVATSPQFFTALAGRKLAFWKRKPWVMEVRDLWPESIKGVGAIQSNVFIKYVEWEELRCYRKATGIVTVTESFRDFIVNKGIASDKIKVVKNGIDPSVFKPKEKDQELLKKLNLENKFIIGYIGTHGMAHKLDFIVHSAAKMDDDNIHFLFIGDGAEKQNVVELARNHDLNNVTFLDPVPKEKIQDYIASIDIALVPLKKSEIFKTVIPSKIFENAAMLKPILLGVDGESRKIIEKYKAGLFFEPENETDFLKQVHRLKNDKTLYQTCQEGCRKLAKDFNRKNLAKDMLNYLKSLA